MRHALSLWTNDPTRAAWADRAGVDRIGLDLEVIGKAERQRGHATWISPHKLEDLEALRAVINHASLFVRTNPLNYGSRTEVEALIDRNVGILMFPNFTTIEEVEEFLSLVDGRAQVVPLVERVAATRLIPDLAELGIVEIHVGLNDLSIELGIRNRLALLTSPSMDALAHMARVHDMRLSVGGLARAMDRELPIPSDLVYAQQARLGSTGALIARSFFTPEMSESDFGEAVSQLRLRLQYWFEAPVSEVENARTELSRRANQTIEEC